MTGWGVSGSSENLDLFYGYRRSFGENRPLIEALGSPVRANRRGYLRQHTVHGVLLSLGHLGFGVERKALVKISQDEWLEVRADHGAAIKEFVAELEKIQDASPGPLSIRSPSRVGSASRFWAS